MSTTSWSEGSIAALLAGVTWREPLVADDGKSGNTLERVEIDGTRYVVKHQSVEADWIMRVTGDRTGSGGAGCSPGCRRASTPRLSPWRSTDTAPVRSWRSSCATSALR
jgi:hypothetical protein